MYKSQQKLSRDPLKWIKILPKWSVQAVPDPSGTRSRTRSIWFVLALGTNKCRYNDWRLYTCSTTNRWGPPQEEVCSGLWSI